jgi:hypothetical protein
MTNIDENCKVIDAQHPHMEPSNGYAVPELSTNDKIIYITKECGHTLSFVHDSISLQIKDNRPVGIQYGQPAGFTFEQAINRLYTYVKGL